jgi:hypothetical protein
MLKVRKFNPVVRATGMIGVVAGLATAVTFAVLQSQATLTANTISSGTAGLGVSNAATCTVDTSYTSSQSGFNFAVTSGVGSSAPQHFCLKNSGTSGLSTLLGVPILPTYIDNNSNPVTVNNSDVHVALNCTTTSSGGITTNDSLSTLNSIGSPIGTLAAGDVADCTATVSIDAAAFTASQILSTGFDLQFTGTGV